MNKKISAIIAMGGTGGHVFPGCNLAKYLAEKNYEVKLTTDKRGRKYLKEFENFNIIELPSSQITSKNIFTILLSSIVTFYGLIRSLFFLIFNRPYVVFGMGGYASFPICLAARILNIKLVIYENNFIIGKANKYLLPFANIILVSNKNLEGISDKFKYKVFEIGNIIKKEIIEFSKIYSNKAEKNRLNILVLGGSQAAKIFAEKLPKIFFECYKKGISIKIYQHCLQKQNQILESFYKIHKIPFETFNFSNNLIKYFSQVNLAITRSGSSMLAELTNANIPFISVPLPSSSDNHQLKNALYYKTKKYSFLIEEKDLDNKLSNLLKDIYNNSSILNNIVQNQRQHSDKNVYQNIDIALDKIINEKN